MRYPTCSQRNSPSPDKGLRDPPIDRGMARQSIFLILLANCGRNFSRALPKDSNCAIKGLADNEAKVE